MSYGNYKTITPWDIIKYAEKYPMDIKTLEETQVIPIHEDNINKGDSLRLGHTPILEKGKMILISPYMPIKEDVSHVIQHELGHTEQLKEDYLMLPGKISTHEDWEQNETERDAERRAALKKASRYGGETRPELIET
jgi:hypothetical protein